MSAAQGLRISASVTALTAFLQTAAYAQNVTTTSTTTPETVVVTGSRFGGRLATDSPTPIDYVSVSDLTKSGAGELQNMLKVTVPSFSTPSPSTAGALDFLQPPTLRGLSPGDLLVLVNGKRYHTDAFLNQGNQIGRGDVEYNLNSLPAAALSGVEVLRDGAAAQYGSDAIAGVINLQLNKRVGTDISARIGETTKGDGQTSEFSLGQGFDLGNGGFIRLTAAYRAQGATNRALPDTRQQFFGIVAGNPVTPSSFFGSGIGLTPAKGTLDPREASFNRNDWSFGQGSYKNLNLVVNAEMPVFTDVTAYAFANYGHLRGISREFYRLPSNDAVVRALHPDGFLPFEVQRLTNFSGTVGVKGDNFLGFGWDISSTYGGSHNQQALQNSNNPSLGSASPLNFPDTGRARFEQWTNNLDLTTEVPLGNFGPLKLAFGAEYRREWYALIAGEPDAYINGGAPILDGPNAGKPAPIGAQPYEVTTPTDADGGRRDSEAVYAEVEKDFGDRLTLDAAIRHENYSDFGETTNYKFAGRLTLFDGLSLRTSMGSGFRAPALAQSFFDQNTNNFVGTTQVTTKFVRPGTALGNLVGAPALKPEASQNISAGLVYGQGDWSGSLDFYQIKLKHRIVLSSSFSSAALTTYLAANGFPSTNAVSYETNAVDTTTRGMDITGRYRADLDSWGQLVTTLAANFSDTEFDKVAGTPPQLAALGITTPLYDLTSQVRLTKATPKNKETLDLDWAKDGWNFDLTNTRYGSTQQVQFASATPAQIAVLTPGFTTSIVPITGSANSQIIQTFRPDIVTDFEASYTFTDGLTLTAGASNLFDIYPEHQLASSPATVAAGTNGSDNAGIFPYAYLAPYGTAGRFVYVKLGYSL
ncbi:MAG: TonB-dependent receptor [Pseudomonadota bacterium]